MLRKTFTLSLQVAILVLLLCSLVQAAVETIATFADPAAGESTPLFKIDLDNDVITGGWPDVETGLTLAVLYSGNIYSNAFFTMTGVFYSNGITGGATGGGIIKFFADGQDASATPLIRIDFDSGYVTPFGLGGMDMFYSNNVTITGSEIAGSLTNESFAFSFANQVPLGGDWNSGYTATASFTSSAAPEPATIGLLGLGGLILLRRKHGTNIIKLNKR